MLGLTWIIIWRKVLLQLHSHLPPVFFLSLSVYLKSVCHIEPPVHIQASCALRLFCDYTGQAILSVCSTVDCKRRAEEICSRSDLLQLYVSGFIWPFTALLWSVYVPWGCIQENTWYYIGSHLYLTKKSLKIEKSFFQVRPGQERNLYMPSSRLQNPQRTTLWGEKGSLAIVG